MKMFYEYQRKNGSLRYRRQGGNPMVDTVDAMRRLSDNERSEFIALWKQFNQNDEELNAKRAAAIKTKHSDRFQDSSSSRWCRRFGVGKARPPFVFCTAYEAVRRACAASVS